MTDIRLPIENVTFALRAGILCVREGELLVVFGQSFDFGYVPGGAVGVNESAAEAAAREWTEETGLPAGPLRLVGVVENFFALNGRRWHEIGLYFVMEPGEVGPLTGQRLLDEPGEVPDQYLAWVPVQDLAARRIYPAVLSELLDVPAGTVRHIVNRE